MVKTRRQQNTEEHGCQPKRVTRSQVQTTHNARQQQLEESDEDIENGSNTSENESDYGSTRGRAPKRRKRARASRNALSKRTGKYLDLLFSMPMDIIFEVAGHLAPQDLLALSWTSKALWRMLHSSNASSVWRAARNTVGAPDCSPGFSEPRWAFLLFGRPICEECGTTNVYNVEFGIRRRVCISCKKQHLVPTVKFEKEFPHYERSIMDMVPYTRSSGWVPRRHPRSPGKFFWTSDVERIASEWAVLQKDIHMYVKGSRAAATTYRMQRIDEAERIAQHADVCDNWLYQFRTQLSAEADRKRSERFEQIQDRLLGLGYDNRDIYEYMFNEPRYQKAVAFTDQFWARIRSKAVAMVELKRVSRVARERDMLRVAHLNLLQALLVGYARSLAPMQWCYLPNVYELAEIPIFKDIIEADESANISRQSFLPATGQFSTLIPEWVSAKKQRIISMLEPSPPETVEHPLDLATAVFKCTNRDCHNNGISSWWGSRIEQALISWEVIAAHTCQDVHRSLSISYNSTNVGFSWPGACTASSLVRLADLDPSSATIAEMDALDLRFACLQCPSPILGRNSVKGYPWKSAVEHGMVTRHGNWHRMSPEETQTIKEHEVYDWDRCAAWSCNHCAADFCSWRIKADVIIHLNNTHQITSPTEPEDLFWYPGKYRIPAATLASTDITVSAPSDVV